MCKRGYVCIYGAYVAHMGVCVSISCIVQPATCSTEKPESANLLASHSFSTISDWINSIFSAFGTSKIGGVS